MAQEQLQEYIEKHQATDRKGTDRKGGKGRGSKETTRDSSMLLSADTQVEPGKSENKLEELRPNKMPAKRHAPEEVEAQASPAKKVGYVLHHRAQVNSQDPVL
jgi:hypothetical protein